MRTERLEFPEAVASLARRAGITLPERREQGPGAERRDQLFALNQFASDFFRHMLSRPEGEGARRYLATRGVAPDIAERFCLGFAPATGTALARALANRRFDAKQAAELGLVGRSQDGRVYDRFRGRLMFPIRQGDGRVMGFGGRILDGEGPKYLNSPESPLFRKGEGVYGLFEARQAIREADQVIIVEGYLDALALVQAGIAYAVATLGTALTVAQLRLLRRFSGNVIAFFDGDAAGQKAAERAFALCAEAGVWARGAFLQDGFDPDTFVRQRGLDATQALLAEAIPLADFYLARIDPGSQAPVPVRARAAAEVARVLAVIKDPFEYDLLVRQAAERLGVSEQTLRRTPAATRRAADAARPPQKVALLPAEEALLVETMTLDPEVARWAQERGVAAQFRNAELAEAAALVARTWADGRAPAGIVDRLPAALAARITAGLLGQGPVASEDRMRIAMDCAEKIERRRQRDLTGARTKALHLAQQRGDDVARTALVELNELLRQRGGGA
jgi:DNA primase